MSRPSFWQTVRTMPPQVRRQMFGALLFGLVLLGVAVELVVALVHG